MFVEFNRLSPDSRVWVYQSDKKFSDSGKQRISEYLKEYCEDWAAHGQPLTSSFEIRFEQVIVLAVDEVTNATSGCSVDDSVRAIKEIEMQTGYSFFNRNLIGFLNENKHLYLLELPTLKEKYRQAIWNESTLTLNNLVSMKSQLDTQWIVPAGQTWLKRYLPVESVKVEAKNL